MKKKGGLLNAELVPNQVFFEAYNEAVLIVSDTYALIYANQAFTQLTGYVLDELGDTALPSKLQSLENKPAIPLQTFGELSFTRKNGLRLSLRVSQSPIILSANSTGLIFTFRSALSESANSSGERRFFELADASPAMIFVENSDQQATYFNKSWVTFTGKSLADLSGKGWLSFVHPDDLTGLEKLRLSVIKGKSYSCETRFKQFDGTFRNIFVIGTPVVAEDGNVTGSMSSCLDITEVKESQNKIAQLSHDLNLCTEELEQFTYVTSHDLQEPLRMITAYVQLIQRSIEKGNPAATQEFMEFVLNGAARMQLLITDLLRLSRVNRKAAPFTPVDMQEVINVAMTHLSKKLKDTGAKINRGDMPVILGDTFQLVTLFENLLDNALKFTSLDYPPVISISVVESDDKYIFKVKDNGIGIDNKFHKRIFAIFQRLHTRGEYEGTGIGLAVCKKIVERHGGEMWVESEPGDGSSFFFSIKK